MQIYMTVNRLNGKFYIGKNKSCDAVYLGSGKILRNALRKYGWWNFYKIILEEVKTVKELNEREKYWIAYYRRLRAHLMYNIGNGGEWGDTFTHNPNKEETRKKRKAI